MNIVLEALKLHKERQAMDEQKIMKYAKYAMFQRLLNLI